MGVIRPFQLIPLFRFLVEMNSKKVFDLLFETSLKTWGTKLLSKPAHHWNQGPIVSGHIFISWSNTSNSACCFGDALRCVAFSWSKHGASQSAFELHYLSLIKLKILASIFGLTLWKLRNQISKAWESKERKVLSVNCHNQSCLRWSLEVRKK